MVRIPISCECRLRHSGLRVYNGLLYKLMFSSCTTWFLHVSYHTFQSLLLVLAFPLFIPGLRQRQKHWYNWEPREQRWHCITMEGGKGTRNGKFGGPASLFDRLFFCFIWRHFPRSAIRWFQWCRLDVYIYVVYLFIFILFAFIFILAFIHRILFFAQNCFHSDKHCLREHLSFTAFFPQISVQVSLTPMVFWTLCHWKCCKTFGFCWLQGRTCSFRKHLLSVE